MPRFKALVYRVPALMSTDLRPRDPIVVLASDPKTNIICGQDSVLVYGPRGCGKSFFALGLGIAIATGTPFLKWKIRSPRRVLYIDGEMPGYENQDRLKAMLNAGPQHSTSRLNNLALFARDWQEQSMPRLDTPEGEQAVNDLIHSAWSEEDEFNLQEMGELEGWNAQVVIIDNASCLFDPEGEEKKSAWQPAQDWLQRLRDHGITSILLHHSGRSGDPRGHSSKEDAVNTVISLTRPPKYTQKQGARFKVEFTKGRSLYGEGADPFIAQFDTKAGWSHEEMGGKKAIPEDPIADSIRKLLVSSPGTSRNFAANSIHGDKKKVLAKIDSLIASGQIKVLPGTATKRLKWAQKI